MGKKLLSVFKVLTLAYAVTGVLLLLAAFIMYKAGLGESQMRIFIMVIYGIATIVAGFSFGKAKGGKRLPMGALIGLLYFVFLTVVSCVVNRGFYEDTPKAILSLVICIVGGILGGVMS